MVDKKKGREFGPMQGDKARVLQEFEGGYGAGSLEDQGQEVALPEGRNRSRGRKAAPPAVDPGNLDRRTALFEEAFSSPRAPRG